MNLFGVLTISGTALLAERERAEVTASNLANAETTRTPQGGPYQRQHVVFAAMRPFGLPFGQQLATMIDFSARGVQVAGVIGESKSDSRLRLRFLPGHQSDRGGSELDGRGAVLPGEYFGGAGDEGHDCLVARDSGVIGPARFGFR
jgi:flagellar basal-body rod protein FlgC